MKRRSGLTTIAVLLLAGGCVPHTTSNRASVDEALQLGRPLQIQSGTKLSVLGVTDDGYAIYQEGTALYATALSAGAPRRFIADTGAAIGVNHPLVFAAGKVAFIYPDSDFSGTLVSRLIVWTEASGPQLAADASLGAPGFVAASPDSRAIVFIANASDDGKRGDLVTADAELSHRVTLVSGVSIDPSGACPPQLGFDRKRSIKSEAVPEAVPEALSEPWSEAAREADALLDCSSRPAHPVAGYCVGSSTTATLSRWIGGARHDLASDIHGFPLWSTDTRGEKLFTLIGHPFANQRPVAIDAHDATTVLEDVTTGGGTINSDGSIMTFAKPAATFEMHHFTGHPAHAEVVTDMGPSFNIYFNMFPRILRDYATGFTSGAGMALFSNPTNLYFVDTTKAPSTAVPLQQGAPCYASSEPFSADSRHALVYCQDATSVFALFDGSSTGRMRKLSSGSAEDFTNFAVDDGIITFADDLIHTPADQDLSATVNIKQTDLAAATPTAKTLASHAYSFYFPTRDRRRIVFTSDNDATAQGLFVLRLR